MNDIFLKLTAAEYEGAIKWTYIIYSIIQHCIMDIKMLCNYYTKLQYNETKTNQRK